MSKSSKNTLIPKLRFPEFKNDGEWKIEPLGELSHLITEKTKGRKYKLMSITSGIGLVSQIEKFGREIAGKSYNNYYIINKGDFAYNKSSTKLYPEGEISLLENEDQAAVPNSIFTCFGFKNKIYPVFAKYPFVNNLHGRWLRRFIAVGARANGALQVNTKDLFSIPFPYPSYKEQKKIAACLSSLDEDIAAESQKLEVLKEHKKGLLQNLFPKEGETVPKLRFKEFSNSREWKMKKLGEVYYFITTNSFSRDDLNYVKGKVKNIHYGDIHTKYSTLFDISKENVPFINNSIPFDKFKQENYCKEGDIIFADASEDLKDIGKSIEIVNINNEKLLSGLHTLLARQRKSELVVGFGGYLFSNDRIKKQIQRESQGAKVLGISATRLSSINIFYPKGEKEQQKIANCLASVDDVITAQSQKVETLKLHKKGLLQDLFPNINEVKV